MEQLQRPFEDRFSSSEEIENDFHPGQQDPQFSLSAEEQKDQSQPTVHPEGPNFNSHDSNQHANSNEEHAGAPLEHTHSSDSQTAPKIGHQDFSISNIYPNNPHFDHQRHAGGFGNQELPQESFDPYGNTIIYKGDNEDSMWLGDGMSTIGGLILQDDFKQFKPQDNQPKNNLFGRAYPPTASQLRTNAVSRSNTMNMKPYDMEASRDGLSLGEITSMPSSLSSSRSYTVYTDSDTSQIMLSQDVFKIILERKKGALLRLKEWEEARIKIINEHRGVCEHLFVVMKKKIAVQKEGIQGLFQFFFERIKQEENFTKTVMKNIPKLDGLFEEIKDKKEPGNLTKILQESDFYHQKCISRGTLLAKHIERQVVQEILVQEERRYNETINPLLETFRKLRKQLNRENEKALQIGRSYLEIYKKSINYGKVKDDLYALELKFLKQANIQLVAQKKLGDFTAHFVGEVKKNEMIRYDNCSKALKSYLVKMNELYHFGSDPAVIIMLDKFSSQQESDDRFALDMILKKEQLMALGKSFPEVQTLTSGEVIQYLQGLKYPDLPANPLIFCDCKASVEKDSQLVGSLDSNLAVTVDANLIVYDLHPVTKDYKVYREIKFKSVALKGRSDSSNIVEFTETRRGLLGKVIRHIHVTFNNTEEKQQFLKTLDFLGAKDVI